MDLGLLGIQGIPKLTGSFYGEKVPINIGPKILRFRDTEC